MKRNIQNTFLSLLVIILSGCTLSMEEYIVSEENKGVDEPHTEVTPFGEVTYKYHDNVLSLNGEPQDYVAMMNDSVIWFMDNIPSRWVPKEGQYIAANCSETIPLGLCSKVLAVTRENGLVKVEFEAAEQEEVFEHLELSLDFDYVVPKLENAGDSVGTRSSGGRKGYWKNDSVFVDMSLYDRMKSGGTRAEGTPSDGTTQETTIWPVQKYFDLPNKKQIYVEFTFRSTEFVNIHQYVNTETEYKEEWNDSYTEREYELLVGYGNNPAETTKNLASFPKGIEEIRGITNAFSAIGMAGEQLKEEKVIKQITPEISIPTFPCGVLLRLDVTGGYSIMGYGHIKAKQRTATQRVGYIYDKGNEKKLDYELDDPVKKPYFRFEDIYFGGSFDLWLRGRLGIGVIVGKGAGVGGVVGAQLQAGVKAKLETESLTEYTVVDRQNFQAGFYATLSGFAEGIAKIGPFTFSLGDFTFSPKELIPNGMWNMKAVVDSKKTSAKVVVDKEQETGDMRLNGKLTFSKLETFFLFPIAESTNQRPHFRVYEEDVSSGNKYYDIYGPDEELKANKTYEFDKSLTELGIDGTLKSYVVVPCIYDKKTKIVTEYRNNTYTTTFAGTPVLDQPKCYEWYGRDVSEEDWEFYKEENPILYGKKRENYAEYAFSTVFNVKNASTIKELGVVVTIKDPDGDVVIKREVPIPFAGVCKNGKYSATFDFIADCKPKAPDSGVDALHVVVKPYCITSGGKRLEGVTSKYMNFYYPYEREGGPVTAENDFYIGAL